jgi:hypothetical protein
MAGEGEHAIQKLEQLERESGLKDNRKIAPQGNNPANTTTSNVDVIDDVALAANYISQSTRMKAEAQSLLAEAQRLEEEAAKLNPTLIKKKVSKSGKSAKVSA